MTKLNRLRTSHNNHVLSNHERIHLKGTGLGNFNRKEGKNCPPPVEQGRINP